MTVQQGQGKFAGAGALHANALGQFHPGTASFAGAGALIAVARQTVQGISVFSGAGSFIAPPASLLLVAYGSFAGAGVLNANTSNLFASTATMAGAGTLNAGAVALFGAAASMAGAGALNASTANLFATFALLFGSGLLYANAGIPPPPPPPVPRPSSGKNIMAVPTLYAIASTSGWTAPSASAPVVHVFGNQPANILVPLSSLPIGAVTLTLTKPDGTTYAANATYSYSAMIFSVAYLIYQADAGELDQVGWWLCSVGGEQCTFFIWPS